MGFSPISAWFSSSSTSPDDPATSAPPQMTFNRRTAPGLSSMSTAVSEASSDDLAQAFTFARREGKAYGGETADAAHQGVTGVARSAREQSQQARERDKSLEVLNTLLAASFTEGLTAGTPFPSLDDTSRSRYTSAIPPAFADLASRYPLITIASLGALGTTVLLGTGALTARVFRSATRTRSPISLDVRLDDMERVIVTKIKQTQRKNAEGLNGALQKLAAVEMGKGLGQPAAAGGTLKSAESVLSTEIDAGGVIPAVDERRLAEVVRETMEMVLAEKQSSQQSDGDGDPGKRYQLSHVLDSVDRLEHITLGILKEIKLLRAAQAASSAPPVSARAADGVLSMEELSGMVEQFQAQARELNKENADSASASAADGVDDTATSGLPAQSDEEDKVARAIYSYDLGAKEEALGVVADELRKAIKPKRGRKAKKAPTEADVEAPSTEQNLDGAQEQVPVELDAHQASVEATSHPPYPSADLDSRHTGEDPLEPTAAADTVQQSPAETEAATAGSATPAEEDASPAPKRRGRKPTSLPESAPRQSTTQARRFGIDDSGAWSCQVMPSKGDFFRLRKWCEMDVVVLKRTGVREVIDAWSGERLAFQSTATECEVVRTSVFRNPDVELIILDGAVWRCYSRSADGEYTIAERIGDA